MDILTRSVAIVRQARVVIRELQTLRHLIGEPQMTARQLERYARSLVKESNLRLDS
jgi:hypothetical protein